MEKEKIINILKISAPILALVLIFSYSNKGNSIEESQGSEIATTTSIVIEKNLKTEFKEKIIVETKKVAQPCGSNNTDFDCHMDYYTDLVENESVSKAFAVIKEEFKNNPYVMAQCHPLTHVIGRVTTEKYKEVNEAFKHGDPFCWSGYYHGVMEKIIEKIGITKIAGSLDNICSLIPGKEKYSFDYYNCVHGLGHGIMAINQNELFQSLKMCDNLSGIWEQNSCYGGVYMENVILDDKGESTKYLKPDDPMYPCNAVEEKYKSQCYLMQTSYALKVLGGDFSKVFGVCRGADLNYRATCWQSLGRDASGRTSSNAEATKAHCYKGETSEERANCITGAVKDFISYFHSDIEAKQFCEILSEDLKQNCLDTATVYYKSF